MRIATWNINSVRLRLEALKRLVAEEAPDVVCLQEIKTPDDSFPTDAVRAMGFDHLSVRGMKSYNGVAVLSRVPLASSDSRDWCDKADCRHQAVRLPDGTELHNFYVPAGGDIPDPDKNEKFRHKLAFLDEMAAWFAAERRADQAMVLVGDLNVAPLENDVWSHKQLLTVVSHTPVEVARLDRLQSGLGWVDAVRHFVPASEKLYTWWSYRAIDWSASDRGRRLDHVWITRPLAGRLRAAKVLRPARGWTLASDHVPVIVDLD